MKGNSECQVGNKLLTLSSRIKSDILNRVVEEIYRYKAYPEDAHFSTVAEALIKKHPCLKEPGSFKLSWKKKEILICCALILSLIDANCLFDN